MGQTVVMVGWLFLLLSLYGAAYTLNAFAPLRRGRVLFIWSFVSSWLTIEGALVHVVWQAAVSALFIWGGALDTWPGRLGALVTVASWIGLLVLHRKARTAGSAVDQALADLGMADPPQRYRRRHVRHTRNVEFGRAGGRRLHLDVFEPSEPPVAGSLRPAVVQIHGGGWIIGFKDRQGIPLLRHMAANGWVGFNIDYRLSPTATWPDHLVDCKAAVAWVRDHAAEYGVDPSFIVATGGSAGGHLTAMLALTAGDPRYQPGFENADTTVQAAVPFYGVYDWTNRSGQYPSTFHHMILEPLVAKAFIDDEPEVFEEASPVLLVERALAAGERVPAPPTLVIHGDHDTLTPVADARSFSSSLAAASDEPVIYVELHGAQHAFDTFRSPRASRVVRGVHRFLDAVWQRHRTGEPLAAADEGQQPVRSVDTGEAVATVDPGTAGGVLH
jgi:acetyl esterase/lipase